MRGLFYLPSSDDTPDAFQNSLEKIIDLIFSTTDQVDRVKFFGWCLSNKSHVAHHHHLALASAAGVTPQAAENWTAGTANCKQGGKIYARVRVLYERYGMGEFHLASDFGQYIGRDFFHELGLSHADFISPHIGGAQ